MLHADEGTLHELIDGSLPPAERERVEQHVGRCAECRARLDEARELVRATASLVEALDVPLAVTVGALPPEVRPRWNPAALGWAASILVAVGIGFAVRPFLPNTATQRQTPLTSPVAMAPRPEEASQKAALEPAATLRRDAPAPNGPPAPVKAAESSADDLSSPTTANTSAPAPAAPAGSTPLALRMHPAAAVALEAAPADTSRRITLEEAVTRLGGSIRLIDGLQPFEVDRAAGATVLGADPGREAVVVRYRDPHYGIVELAQQRILTADSLDAERQVAGNAARQATVRFAPQPQSVPDPKGAASLSWSDPQGFHLVLTAAISPESLVALRARVK